MRKVLFGLVLAVSCAQAQQLTPSAKQHAKLLKQSAKVTKLQSQAAFELFRLAEMCRAVALENHWPATAECSQPTMLFTERQVSPPVPASAIPPKQDLPKPEEKK